MKESFTLGKQANKQTNKNQSKNQDINYVLMENVHFLYPLFCIAQDERFISVHFFPECLFSRVIYGTCYQPHPFMCPRHEISITRTLASIRFHIDLYLLLDESNFTENFNLTVRKD